MRDSFGQWGTAIGTPSTIFTNDTVSFVGIGTRVPSKTLQLDMMLISQGGGCTVVNPTLRLSYGNPAIGFEEPCPGNEGLAPVSFWDLVGGNQLSFQFNGTQRMNLTSTGRLGVNVGNVNYSLNLDNSLSNTKVAVYDDGTASGVAGIGFQTNQLRFHLTGSLASSNRFSFLSSPTGTEVMSLTRSGNLGIGNSNPPSRLFVRSNNDISTNNFAQFVSANGTQGIGIGFNSINAIGSNVNQDIVFNPKGTTGRVTVGVVPSSAVEQIKLQVASGNIQSITGNFSSTSAPVVGDRWNALGDRIPFATTAGFASTGLRSQWDQYGANFGLVDRPSSSVRDGIIAWQDATTTADPSTLTASNSRLRFVFRNGNIPSATPNALEAMTILANGRVGIGTNNPGSLLSVAGGVSVGSGFASLSAPPNGLIVEDTVFIGTSTAVSASNEILQINGEAYADAWNTPSDLRFKKNIEKITDALNTVISLEGVSYNWDKENFPSRKFSSLRANGIIAQELAKYIPNAVKQGTNGFYSVNYDAIIPVLIEAIKELNLKVDSQSIEGSTFRISSTIVEKQNLGHELFQNRPNPFSTNTVIDYQLGKEFRSAYIQIFEPTGKPLMKFENLQSGKNSIEVQAGNLSAGLYLYALVVDGRLIAQKSMIVEQY